MIGYCKYCGQSFMTEQTSEETANYQATMNCKCDKALEFKRVEEMKELAESNIDALFQDQTKPVREMLIIAATMIAERRMNSVTVKVSGKISATVAKGKEGIVVKRKYTEENTLES